MLCFGSYSDSQISVWTLRCFRVRLTRVRLDSGTPLTIPPPEVILRQFRTTRVSDLWSESSGHSSETTVRHGYVAAKPVKGKSDVVASSKIGEKEKTKKKSSGIAINVVRTITKALNQMAAKYQDDSTRTSKRTTSKSKSRRKN